MSDLAVQLIRKEKQARTGKLDLGYCGLRSLPNELFDCTWLEELYLCSGISFLCLKKLEIKNYRHN